MNRRSFLKIGVAASVAGVASRPRRAMAGVANSVLVVVFVRGGVDALSFLAPHTGPNRTTYVANRPKIHIVNPVPLTNSSVLGLHPVLVKLRALYEAGESALVLGAGSVNPTRSHFEQSAFIEGGDPTTQRSTGYLNRALAVMPSHGYALQALALQDEVPQSLRGPSIATRVPSLDRYGKLWAPGMIPGLPLTTRVSEFAASAEDVNPTATRIRAAAGVLATSVGDVGKIVSSNPAVSSAATYGGGEFGNHLRDAARVMAAEPRVRVIEVDHGQVDLHARQGNDVSGELRYRLGLLDTALGAFVADGKRLGFWSRTCVVVMSEFGRTVRENGSLGTDHGRGGVAFVAGPSSLVRGKRVVAPGFSLQPSALFEGRDLPVTTDLRSLMGEVLTKHLAVGSLTSVFPGWSPTYPGLLV